MTSNAVNSPSLTLELAGEVVVDVEIEPPRLGFGELRKGEAAVRPFTVTIHEPGKYKLGALRVDDERFTIIEKGEQSYELSFKGSDTLESISTKVFVAVQGDKARTIEVPVSVRVVGDITYTKNIYLLKKNGVFTPKEIKLSSRSGRAIRLLGASDPDANLKATTPKKPGKELVLSVNVADPSASYKQPRRGALVLRTDDKDMPEISVSYTISEPRVPIISTGSTSSIPVRIAPPLVSNPAPPPKKKVNP